MRSRARRVGQVYIRAAEARPADQRAAEVPLVAAGRVLEQRDGRFHRGARGNAAERVVSGRRAGGCGRREMRDDGGGGGQFARGEQARRRRETLRRRQGAAKRQRRREAAFQVPFADTVQVAEEQRRKVHQIETVPQGRPF